MPGTTDFTVLLRERLAAAEAARADRVRANEDTMRERQIHSERFGHLASLLHQAIVRPMIDELTSHFENVTPICTCDWRPTWLPGVALALRPGVRDADLRWDRGVGARSRKAPILLLQRTLPAKV
jgi:hypothetical protein